MNDNEFMDWLDASSILKNKDFSDLIQDSLRKHMKDKAKPLIFFISHHKNQEKTAENKKEESVIVRNIKKGEYVIKISKLTIIFSLKSSVSVSLLGSRLETSPAKASQNGSCSESPQCSLVFRIREFFHRIFMTHTSQAYVLEANAAKRK